jgi:hypothetical protein
MLQRNYLTSPRLSELKKRRRIAALIKICFFVFVFVIFAGLLVYISRAPSVNISDVKITGNATSDSEAIKELVQKEIQGHYLWFLPKTNILFYPKNDIRNKLYAKFKGISSIAFSIRSGNTLELSLSQRTALYTWCGDAPPDNAPPGKDEKCYFLDKDGYIFDEAAYFSGEVYFKFYGPTAIANILTAQAGSPAGSYFYGQNFGKLIDFKTGLEKLLLKPVALYAGESGEIKIYLLGGTMPLGPQIFFRADSDFSKAEENLEAALTTEPLQSDFKNKYSSLQYIDLRYGNKVYYKFR